MDPCRCAGKVDADITPIGYLPKAEDICIDGLEGITLDTVRDLLSVDTAAWLEDVENIKEFYAQVGDHVPQAMYDELAALEARLKAADKSTIRNCGARLPRSVKRSGAFSFVASSGQCRVTLPTART